MLPLVVNKIRSDGPREGLSNSFGKVRNGGTKWHRGWDLSADVRSDVFSVGDGVVVQSHSNVSGYGRCLLIETNNPKYKNEKPQSSGLDNIEFVYILYAHLSKSEVETGEPVTKGDLIAKTGNSGNAAGEPPHLHLEILLEDKINKSTLRVDPGEILGYDLYVCGGDGIVNQEVFGSCKR